jgi:predicted transcriptional regulator
MIRTLEQMEEKVLALKKKHYVAVAWAQDTNTICAINKHAKLRGLMTRSSHWLNQIMRARHLPKP